MLSTPNSWNVPLPNPSSSPSHLQLPCPVSDETLPPWGILLCLTSSPNPGPGSRSGPQTPLMTPWCLSFPARTTCNGLRSLLSEDMQRGKSPSEANPTKLSTKASQHSLRFNFLGVTFGHVLFSVPYTYYISQSSVDPGTTYPHFTDESMEAQDGCPASNWHCQSSCSQPPL